MCICRLQFESVSFLCQIDYGMMFFLSSTLWSTIIGSVLSMVCYWVRTIVDFMSMVKWKFFLFVGLLMVGVNFH